MRGVLSWHLITYGSLIFISMGGGVVVGAYTYMHMRMNINIAHVLSTTFTTKLLLSEEGQEGTHHALKRYV